MNQSSEGYDTRYIAEIDAGISDNEVPDMANREGLLFRELFAIPEHFS
ncbi:MAG: hypothetical protein WA130_18270 [Candidatus Methanoperedens sp.]